MAMLSDRTEGTIGYPARDIPSHKTYGNDLLGVILRKN